MGNVKRVWNNQTPLAVWDLFNNDLSLNILCDMHIRIHYKCEVELSVHRCSSVLCKYWPICLCIYMLRSGVYNDYI